MPIFKTNQDIFKTFGEEVYDPNTFDTPFLTLPPSPEWDNSRELQIEDVDIWEVIYEAGGGNSLYAAWCPYAQFFMLLINGSVETFYGIHGEKMLEKKLQELNIQYPKV